MRQELGLARDEFLTDPTPHVRERTMICAAVCLFSRYRHPKCRDAVLDEVGITVVLEAGGEATSQTKHRHCHVNLGRQRSSRWSGTSQIMAHTGRTSPAANH